MQRKDWEKMRPCAKGLPCRSIGFGWTYNCSRLCRQTLMFGDHEHDVCWCLDDGDDLILFSGEEADDGRVCRGAIGGGANHGNVSF